MNIGQPTGEEIKLETRHRNDQLAKNNSIQRALDKQKKMDGLKLWNFLPLLVNDSE